MFKKILMSIVSIIIVLSLVACSSGNDEGEGTGETKVKTIRISHVLAEDHPTNTTLVEYFKPMVEENSNGEFKVEIYPNAQLGSDRQAIESVGNGSLEMSVPGGPVLSGFYEPFMVYDLPFLFDSKQAAYDACDGELKDILAEKVLEKQNFRILGIGENGFRHITNNAGPIKEPADLKGLKIRTMESPNHLETFKALGANATPLAFNELFTALQQGTVDGQENPIAIIYTSRIFEVQDYLTLDGHYYVNCPYIVNEDFWKGLSPEQQTVIQDAVNETIKQQRMALQEQEDEYLELLKEEGVNITELTTEQRQKFIDQTSGVYDWFIEKYGEEASELVDLARSYNK